MAYTVIYTGSRDLTNQAAVWADLDRLIAEHPDLGLHVGDWWSGLDRFVRDWSRRRWGARWRDYCGVYEAHWLTLGRRAGPERNGRMVADGGDECRGWWAPPPALNLGTSGCCELARKAGIKVVEYGRESQPVQMELPL